MYGGLNKTKSLISQRLQEPENGRFKILADILKSWRNRPFPNYIHMQMKLLFIWKDEHQD